MSMATAPQTQWITGDEFNREVRRLIDQGVSDEDPRMRTVYARMSERNHYLFERFGKKLVDRYPNWYVAISVDGKTLVRQRAGDLVHDAEDEFGTYDFAVFRLSDPPYDSYHC